MKTTQCTPHMRAKIPWKIGPHACMPPKFDFVIGPQRIFILVLCWGSVTIWTLVPVHAADEALLVAPVSEESATLTSGPSKEPPGQHFRHWESYAAAGGHSVP